MINYNYLKRFTRVLEDMSNHAAGTSQNRFILTGDTGIGKTSFVDDFAKFCGFYVVDLEAPHIVEEHIIDIPFTITKKAPGGAEKHVTLNVGEQVAQKADGTKEKRVLDIAFARSYLYKQLAGNQLEPEENVIRYVYSKPNLKSVWTQLGGTDKELPKLVREARQHVTTILFLDEYLRQTSEPIRNQLRSILNGMIGPHKLPKSVYTIYATNIVDDGLVQVMPHEEFQAMSFDTPDAKDWEEHILSKNPDYDNELTKKIIKFIKDKKVLSYNEGDSKRGARISPRRWEQLLHLINGSLPLKDEDDAAALLKNVETNFRQLEPKFDEDGNKVKNVVDIGGPVLDIVKDYVKKQGFTNVSEESVDDESWDATLDAQIKAWEKSGGRRKNVPIISGKPGIGKTLTIKNLAKKYNVVAVVIDVHLLSATDVIGIPLSETMSEDMDIKFSEPPLLKMIKKQAEENKQELPDEEAWLKQKFKYILFFDETNRAASPKVFNAIRKVLLTKRFNAEYALPPGTMIIGAINPEGKGTIPFTRHVKDVFDIIHATPSNDKFNDHIDKVTEPKLQSNVNNKVAIKIAKALEKSFIDHYSAGPKDKFTVRFTDSLKLHLSSRQRETLVSSVAKALDTQMDIISANKIEQPEAHQMLVDTAFEKYHEVFDGQKLQNGNVGAHPDWWKGFHEWLKNNDAFNLFFQGVMVDSVTSLTSILDKSLQTGKDIAENPDAIQYLTAHSTDFSEELAKFIHSHMKDKDLFEAKYPLKEIQGDGDDKKIVHTDEKINLPKYIANELLLTVKILGLKDELFVAPTVHAIADFAGDIEKNLSDSQDDAVEVTSFVSQVVRKLRKIK